MKNENAEKTTEEKFKEAGNALMALGCGITILFIFGPCFLTALAALFRPG